eukprot:768557-Hanusia_phi.AAC.4
MVPSSLSQRTPPSTTESCEASPAEVVHGLDVRRSLVDVQLASRSNSILRSIEVRMVPLLALRVHVKLPRASEPVADMAAELKTDHILPHAELKFLADGAAWLGPSAAEPQRGRRLESTRGLLGPSVSL